MWLQVLGALLVIIALAFGFLCLDYHQHRWPVKNFPPGPYGWPVLGSPMMMDPEVHLQFKELSQKYGDVFSIALGRFLVVVVNGQDAVKEAIVTNMNATASRGENYVQTLYNPEHRGIIDGCFSESWRRQRHFAHTALRSLGFGKASSADKVMVEVQETLDLFEQKDGQPFNPFKMLSAATSSVMCTIAMGVRFNCNEEHYLRMSEISNNWLDIMYSSSALNAFPFVRPFVQKMKDNVKGAFEGLAGFVHKEIKNHEDSFEMDNKPRDFIDCYLAEMRRNPELYTREDLTMILIDFFIGGNETTALQLTFALLLMIRNPDIQEKVHQEIVQVVGCERLPTMKDRTDLPYTAAVIKEVMRHKTLVPAVFRSTVKDFILNGHTIPKGTGLIINLWSINHDPKAWTNPDEFNPNRFVGVDKKNLVADSDHYLPFGAGRRVCLGEQLAKMELFLFFACLMQRFKFSIPPGCDKPSDTGATRFLLYPPYYELIASPRF